MQLSSGTVITAKAVAFDMDGTLVHSAATIEDLWRSWASVHNIDSGALLEGVHGQRAIDTIRLWAPRGLDPEMELRRLVDRAAASVNRLREVPGAGKLLRSLLPGTWAIVTSAEKRLAIKWLEHLRLPLPGVLIAAEDVSKGKPDPAGYLLAAERLGCVPEDLVIFEDAPAGFAAGDASQGRVIAVASKLKPEEIDPRPWIVDFSKVTYGNNSLSFH